MTNLIPFDELAAEALDGKLAATMFRSTQDFISFYNSGLINKGADEVVAFANEIDACFKNVKLQGKNLVFISVNEVYMHEIVEALKPWEILVKAKRAVEDLIKEGVLEENSLIDISSGSIQLAEPEADGFSYKKLSDEKLFKGSEDELVAEIHEKYSSSNRDDLFVASDFLLLEDGFIADIHSRIFG